MLVHPIPEPELAQIADETSQTERRAAEAERELVEWKKVRFMQDRVGDEFAALVLNPAKYGLFVELTDLFVEGLVPIDTLRGDRYIWRENTHEIVGERTGRRFRVGDRVQVILDRILAQERKLQFAIVEEELPLTGKKLSGPVKIEEEQAQKRSSPPPGGGSGDLRRAAGVKAAGFGRSARRYGLTARLFLSERTNDGNHKLPALKRLDDGNQPDDDELRNTSR